MLEVLDLPAIRKQVAPISVDRYHRMIDAGLFDDWDVELIDGALIKKMSKTPLHVFVVLHLFDRLTDYCSGTPFQVRKEDPLTIGNSEPEPDISVVEGPRSRFMDTNPTTGQFVIEVAISTLAMDRAKTNDYAAAAIPEYWIVRPKAQKVEVYRKPNNGQYAEKQVIEAGTTIESTALPEFSFNLADALAKEED